MIPIAHELTAWHHAHEAHKAHKEIAVFFVIFASSVRLVAQPSAVYGDI
jgi:hypothetical protein